MFKEKVAFGKGFDSLLFLFARGKKKSVLNYDLGGRGMLGKLFQKSNSKQ